MNYNRSLAIAIIMLSATLTYAQHTKNETHEILSMDSTFWELYNKCDIDGMRNFLVDDLEFYHDKGGMTKGLNTFLSKTQTNLCSDNNFRLRRDLVPNTMEVHILKNNNKAYAAIISGEHTFSIIEKGKSPRIDGMAKFTHLVFLTDNGWKMARVMSYDHHSPPYINNRKEVKLTGTEIRQYEGNYNGPNAGKCKITESNGLLQLIFIDNTYILHPESSSVFL